MSLQAEDVKIIVFGGTASLLVFIGLILYLVIVFNKNARDRQRDNFKAILDAVEAERTTIGQNLHDEIGAILGGVKLGLNALEPALSGDKELIKIFQSNKDSIGEAMNGVRNAAHNLSSLTLNRFGIVKAIEERCTQVNYSKEWKASFDASQFKEQLDLSLAINLYRIISELINNSLKHAQGSEINIKLSKVYGVLRLEYADNGVGIDSSKLNRGLGLRSIATRVELIKGTYRIKTAVNSGFQIDIQVN